MVEIQAILRAGQFKELSDLRLLLIAPPLLPQTYPSSLPDPLLLSPTWSLHFRWAQVWPQVPSPMSQHSSMKAAGRELNEVVLNAGYMGNTLASFHHQKSKLL